MTLYFKRCNLQGLCFASIHLFLVNAGGDEPPSCQSLTVSCQSWCIESTFSWAEKCQWELSCAPCKQCNHVITSDSSLEVPPCVDVYLPPTMKCESSCYDYPALPWTHVDPSIDQICKRRDCAGCSECTHVGDSNDITTKTKESCQSWCPIHPVPWKRTTEDYLENQKCDWGTCGGCEECNMPNRAHGVDTDVDLNTFENEVYARRASPTPTFSPTLAPKYDETNEPTSRSPIGIASESPTIMTLDASHTPTLAATYPEWGSGIPSLQPTFIPSSIVYPISTNNPSMGSTLNINVGSSSPSANLPCKSFCDLHGFVSWSQKCTWTRSCSGCPNCLVEKNSRTGNP